MSSLKSRIQLLEGAGALLGPTMIYIGDTSEEQARARAAASKVKGVVIFVSPLDRAL